jgi:hypothetical protein
MRSVLQIRPAVLVVALLGAAAFPASAQECYLQRGDMAAAAQRPSPLGQTTITLNGQEGTICYGRPSAKGRMVMGDLVPFGQPWRLGANEATALHLPFATEVGGVALEPGSYSLYAVPGPEEWEIFVNRNYRRWGIPIDDGVMAETIGSFTRPVESLDPSVEQLTFRWESHGDEMGHLIMEWENTRVDIPIHAVGE